MTCNVTDMKIRAKLSLTRTVSINQRKWVEGGRGLGEGRWYLSEWLVVGTIWKALACPLLVKEDRNGGKLALSGEIACARAEGTVLIKMFAQKIIS